MRLFFLVVLLLAGCANPNFDAGMSNFNAGNYEVARQNFQNCFNQSRDSGCATNAGISSARMGDMESAKRWLTLAARYGNTDAVAALNKFSWPVPFADIAQQQSAETTDTILKSVGQGLQNAGNVMRSPAPKQIDPGCWSVCVQNAGAAYCNSKCSY